MGIKFLPFPRRENRRSLAIFFAEEIAHVGALKIARFCGGAVKIAAATAENRAILVHSGSLKSFAEGFVKGSQKVFLARVFWEEIKPVLKKTGPPPYTRETATIRQIRVLTAECSKNGLLARLVL